MLFWLEYTVSYWPNCAVWAPLLPSVFACALATSSSALAQTRKSVLSAELSASLPDVRKKKRLSLVLSDAFNASGTDHFQFVGKGFVPGNTQQSTQWAMKVFSDWTRAREVALEEACPEDSLERANPEDLVRQQPLCQRSWIRFWKASQDFDSFSKLDSVYLHLHAVVLGWLQFPLVISLVMFT